MAPILKSSVVLDKKVLDGFFALFINVFLIVGNEGLGQGLSDSVDLLNTSPTLNEDRNVNFGETVCPQQQNRLLKLELQRICKKKISNY